MIKKTISLYDYQETAVNQLKTGSILNGGVGSGKSRTAIMYFFKNEKPKDLYIITTAAKRDTFDWQNECEPFMLERDGVIVTVDSWNNIKKYEKIEDAFFIFDEQRVVGSGAWVKSFLKITKNNNWILLSATPGDTWLDYVPVFIANGFYKNRTEFIRRHVVFSHYMKFPKVDHYVEEARLRRLKNKITVAMEYETPTKINHINVPVNYNKELFNIVIKDRWNPYKNKPIKDITDLFFTMRKVVNSDDSRLIAIKTLIQKHMRLIIFYNFNYELEKLRGLGKEDVYLTISEHNGYKHEPIPETNKWIYLVQYMSGAEGWNCITTNTVVFYSQNYSYRMMHQAAGRIDRLNTPFTKLYYYHLVSESVIDKAIAKALHQKRKFNEKKFATRQKLGL